MTMLGIHHGLRRLEVGAGRFSGRLIASPELESFNEPGCRGVDDARRIALSLGKPFIAVIVKHFGWDHAPTRSSSASRLLQVLKNSGILRR